MVIKFTSVAYVILQVTKKKTTQEKKNKNKTNKQINK